MVIDFSLETLNLIVSIAILLNILWVSELYFMKRAIKRALDKCQLEEKENE